MRIDFNYVKWRNFLGTGNDWIEIDVRRSATTLVVGKNGAGKSQMLDALSFALFGVPFRKAKRQLQLVNSITNREAEAVVSFNAGDREYVVSRGLKPNKFIVEVDGIVDDEMTQEDLEKILGMNNKSFRQIVVMGSANYKPFMELNTGERRVIVEDLLDQQLFTTMNQLLRTRIGQYEQEYASVLSDLTIARMEVENVERRIAHIDRHYEEQIATAVSEHETVHRQVVDVETELYGKSERQQGLIVATSARNLVDDRLKKLRDIRLKVSLRVDGIKKQQVWFEHTETCPTCQQMIGDEIKKHVVEKSANELREIDEGNQRLEEEIRNVESMALEYDKHASNLVLVNQEMFELETRRESLKSQLVGLRQRIEQLENEAKSVPASADLTAAQEKVDRIEAEEKKLVVKAAIYEAAQALLKDGGIKARMIRQYVPVINKLIAKYLASLDFMCQFELDEHFNETIKSRFRDEFSYGLFSQGEAQRIDLALMFTWRAVAKLRNGASTNLIVFDETLDRSLDQDGVDDLMKTINQLTDGEKVFIISHRGDTLVDKFSDVIEFKKVKSFSSMTRESEGDSA